MSLLLQLSTCAQVDPQYFRPTEVEELLGDATKAATLLNWKPKILFETLVQEMVDADVALVEKGDMIN